LEADFGSGIDTLPTEEFPVCAQKNLFDAPRQVALDCSNEGSRLLPVQDIPFPEFAKEALPGFIYKTQHRTVGFLPSMSSVVSHTPALLVAIDRFGGGIDAEMDHTVSQATQLPGTLPQSTVHLDNGVGLIDAETVHVSPVGARSRQLSKLKETADHGIQPDVDKVPQPIKPDEEQHQDPNHHPVVAQFGGSFRPPVEVLEDFFKPEQIQKFDHSKKPTERGKPFIAGTVWCGGGDFTGPTRFLRETFTSAVFRSSMKSLFNHLGYLLSMMCFGKNPFIIGKPRWFSIF
jgi:hypothetical protein